MSLNCLEYYFERCQVFGIYLIINKNFTDHPGLGDGK